MDKGVIFVGGFLSVSNVGKQWLQKICYRGGVLWLKMYENYHTRKKTYMPWTVKCQFLLMAFYVSKLGKRQTEKNLLRGGVL